MSSASKLSQILFPLGPGEIRTLHLQPGSLSDPVQVTLCHVYMGSHLSSLEGDLDLGWVSTAEQNASSRQFPQYDALSYMWGPGVTKPIEINGSICEIRENLSQALVHLRLANQTRVLWVEAICIDQESVEERKHQVAQMGKIYSKAAGSWSG
jgi:hypothetical protein